MDSRLPILLSIAAGVAIADWRADLPSAVATDSTTTSSAISDDASSTLWMDMRNVDLHVDSVNVMHVRSLRGQVVSTKPGTIAWLDDPRSFHIRATSGVVAL